MSYFLDSVCTIVGIFHKYARCQDGNLALNRREMKMLIQKEFGEVLENPCDPQIIELTFKLLDVNGDSLVDFNEYLIFVFQIAKGCYRYLQPREYLLRDESSRALHEGESGGSKRERRQLQDGERRGDYVPERRGLDGRFMEEGRRREVLGCYLPIGPVEEEEDHNFEEHDRELRDGHRRDCPSWEHQERDREGGHLDSQRQEDIEILKPRQLRQRESALEDVSPRQPQELVRRNDIDRCEAQAPLDEEDLYSPTVVSRREEMRQRRGQETKGRLFRCGSQARVDHAEYDVERGRLSHEQREREDGWRDLEAHNERRSRAFEPRGADERQDRIHHRSPVDDSVERRSLSRESERRSQSHEADQREGERRRRQERYVPQSREDAHRATRAEEEEVRRSERRRVEYDWSRPRSREASRRAEVEGLERRERESRRPYSSEFDNMGRPSRSRESEGREEVRRSQRPEDDEQEFSREETRAAESGRRRPQSQEPEARDPKYERSQSYEELRRDDQRRSCDYEVYALERDVARRRLQPHQSPEREDHQERQRYYEHESSQSRESEGRGEVRRSQRPEDIERRRREFSREETKVMEVRRRRSQSLEPVARDIRYVRYQRYEEPRRDDQRRPRDYEVHSLEREVARRRRIQPRQSPEREDNQERQRWSPTQTDLAEDDQKPTNPYEVDPRNGEQQRRAQSSVPNFKGTEVIQHNMGNSFQPREATSLSNQTADREFDLLRDQRPPESGESQPSRRPGQPKAEESLVSPHTLQQQQATRESQRLSGPELRGPQRRWLQHHQTEGREEEVGVNQTQRKAGSPVSNRALSQPSERQVPEIQAEGQSELSLAGEGDKAEEPAALDQQQVHREGEAPQPEVEDDDGSGSWAQESQPLLEDEDQHAIPEKPSTSLVESKSCMICNPLYEYLLAQKKQEEP
ncbi:trichohyalin-like [Crotalus adamanteus]|uniref:Trichohyalin-like n=1 Tax=Crotalus adamanteus TaxID=8729 RepID=A0AAW1AN88_CROAD